MDDFKNLNGPSADSIQGDYIEKEKRAAEELLKIQLKNAQTLADLRLKLLDKLNNEALDEGQAVEDYLAQYGLQKRLDALSDELKSRQQGYTDHLDELSTIHQRATEGLIAADKKLATIREKRAAEAAKLQLQQIKKAAEAEQQAILDNHALRRKLEGVAVPESNLKVEETEVPVEVNQTLAITPEINGEIEIPEVDPVNIKASAEVELTLPTDQPIIEATADITTVLTDKIEPVKLAGEVIVTDPVELEAQVTLPELETVELEAQVILPELETLKPQIEVSPVEADINFNFKKPEFIEPVEAELNFNFEKPEFTEPLEAELKVSLPESLLPEELSVSVTPDTSALENLAPISLSLTPDTEAEAELLKLEKKVYKERDKHLKALKKVEDNIIKLRLGAEKDIFESRLELLTGFIQDEIGKAAEVLSESIAAITEEVIETAASTELQVSVTPQVETPPEPVDVEVRANVQAAAVASEQASPEPPPSTETTSSLFNEKTDANLQDIKSSLKELDAVYASATSDLKAKAQAEILRIQQADGISQAGKLKLIAEITAEQEKQEKLLQEAKLVTQREIYEQNLALDAEASANRLSMALSAVEVEYDARGKSEEELAAARLAHLQDNLTRSEKERKKQLPKANVGSALSEFKKQQNKKAEDLKESEEAQSQEALINQFNGLFNYFKHSAEDIEHVFSNYGDIDINDANAASQIQDKATEVATNQVNTEIAEQEATAEADYQQQMQDIDIKALAEGWSEVQIAAARAEAEEKYKAAQEEIALRRSGANDEIAMRAAAEKDKAAQLLKDANKSKKAQDKLDKKKKTEDSRFGKSLIGKGLGTISDIATGGNIKDRIAAGEDPEKAKEAAQAKLDAAFAAVGNWVYQLAEQGKKSSSKQASIDTNLQGSQANGTVLGSYWRKLDAKINMGVGVSPFVLQENVAASVEKLAGQGISFNIQQRALMDTLKDKIATTFNAADGTMLKLIRIQQADTTAARLGMESALTSFLNSMYETSEFMHTTAASIRDNLYEATALMGAKEATAYEFQVQKWLGSMYSVGFSATEKVSEALGKLTAGDISGITEGGMGNLLVMAANEASLPIADILEKGLTADQTDRLMESMVNYLSRIYEETKGSNVLAQQYGAVFGVTAADLKAIANLGTETINNIAKHDATYSQMLGQLDKMANTLILRTSTAEMFENLKQNFSYTMATTLANNPVLSSLNMMANMLNDLVGGIEIPFVNVYGFGFDLNATLADLMNVAALSGAVLGGMGKMIAGLGSTLGGGSAILRAFGVENGDSLSTVTRGNGGVNLTTQGGASQSESGSVAGNESGEDIQNKTLQDASEGPEKQIAEAKEEQEDKEETRHNEIITNILSIYDLLEEVTNGVRKWHVQLEIGNNPASWSTGTWT